MARFSSRPIRPAKRTLLVEALETRQLLAALPLGAMPLDTGEYMLGTVAVTPVLFESDGSLDPNLENWTTAEINQVLSNMREGLQWWVNTLEGIESVHSLEFRVDETFARNPVPTPFEPITRRSDSYTEYVGKFMVDQGYANPGLTLEDAVRLFNHDQRVKLGTDWAFTIFIVDASNDSDGMFDLRGSFPQAFAFAGGAFFVTPSVRPPSTYAHETGHMFWARDEYPDSGRWDERRGYYNSQNSNAVDGAPAGFVQRPSIMSAGLILQQAYNARTSAAPTLAQLGWVDSDGDGVFDVLDVPLELDVSAVYRAATQTIEVRGRAAAVPLHNVNSSGLRNDITLNKVSRIEYRIDAGPWLIASTPNLQTTAVELELPVSGNFNQVELRAVDASTGIASNVVVVTTNRPTAGLTNVAGGTWEGFVFLDTNGNGSWDSGEGLLNNAIVTLANDGSIRRGRLEPDETPGTIYDTQQSGFRIQSVGNQVDGRVAAFAGASSTGSHNFHFATLFGTWSDSWTYIKQQLRITMDQPTNAASIVAVGKGANSYGRLEAYDANGVLIARSTSGPLAIGQSATLEVFDPQGRIATLLAFGHAGTSVSLDDFRYGPELSTTSGQFGTFFLEGIPDGEYSVSIQSPSNQYAIVNPQVTVEFVNGQATPLGVAAERSTSPWMNASDPFDVNDNNVVQPLDALIVINDLNRNGPRRLQTTDPTFPYLDVNGDLSVSPIDALQIINFLNRQPSSGGGEGEFAGPSRFGNNGNGLSGQGFARGADNLTLQWDFVGRGNVAGDRLEPSEEGEQGNLDVSTYYAHAGGVCSPVGEYPVSARQLSPRQVDELLTGDEFWNS